MLDAQKPMLSRTSSSESSTILPPVLARVDRVRIGLALRTRRLLKGEEQTATAAAAGVGVGTLQAIETARYAVKPQNIERLAAYFGTSVISLLDQATAQTGPSLELSRLTREDLEVARLFHDASTTVRQAVISVLKELDPTPLTDAQRARAKTLADQLVRLAPADFALVMLVLGHLAPAKAGRRPAP